MKILQLIDSLNIGGAERMSINIANAFAENNIVSDIITSRKGGPLKTLLSTTVGYHSLHKKSQFDIFAFYRLVKLVRKIRPDIIHAHSTSIYWAVASKFFVRNVKIIWHHHFGLSNDIDDNQRKSIKFISGKIDGVIVVSEALEKWCHKNLKVAGNSIIYLKNFPHLPIIQPLSVGAKPVFLNLANFRPEKDQLNLLEAAKIIRDAGYDFELWLAGEHKDAELTNKIKETIENLNLENEVKILGAIENPVEILSKASVGVLSSYSEGLPVSLLEYGLAKLPVIATDVGQCREVLMDGKLGIIVPTRNAKALAGAMIEVMADPIAAQKNAVQFHDHVIEEYGAKKFLAAYINFIGNILRL